MSNVSEATEALMTEATADTEVLPIVATEEVAETDSTESAEDSEDPESSDETEVESEPFVMDPSGRPFKRLRALYDSGDTDAFGQVVSAMELVFGHVPEVIEKGFHATLMVAKSPGPD